MLPFFKERIISEVSYKLIKSCVLKTACYCAWVGKRL